jgi:sugar phosphate isomerase/epimerase
MTSRILTRRDALKTTALSALTLPLLGTSVAHAADSTQTPAKKAEGTKNLPLHLGVASYSLSKLTVDEVIGVLKELDITAASLYKTHAPWADGTPEQCRDVVQRFKDAGITITSTGMIELPNDEAVIRKAFDNVRAAGLKTLCGWFKQTDSLPLVDKLVKEYDLKVAIHNHGPTEQMATGMDVWTAVQPYDKRLGLCLDVGHGFRAGENPAQTIRQCSERLYEVHLRDTAVKGGTMKDPQPVVIGHGLLDFRSIIAALLEVKYPFQAEFEYEKKEENRVPGLAESVGYVRGLTVALA